MSGPADRWVMDRRLRVAVVDDHPVVISGVTNWFREADIEVVATGPSIRVALQPPGLDADVVVLDLHLSGQDAPAWNEVAELAAAGRRIVVYTMAEDRYTALRCLSLGCATVLTKAEGERHLVAAVRAAAEDRPYVAPSMAGAISADDAADRPQLSDREQEVLLAWFQCESKQLVAARCGLSPRTVEGYIDRVRVRYARVGRPAPTKAALVARALQDGIIDLEDL